MATVIWIVLASIGLAYFILTEAVDWAGRYEWMQAHAPRLIKWAEKRHLRVIALLLVIGIQMKIIFEEKDKAESQIPVTISLPSIPAPTVIAPPKKINPLGFNLEITGISTGQSRNPRGDLLNKTTVELSVFIHNEGESSIAHDWQLEVHAPTGSIFNAGLLPGHKPQLTLETNTVPLDEKLGNSPLLSQGDASGRLTFIIDNVLPDVTNSLDTIYILSAKDKFNRTWKASNSGRRLGVIQTPSP